MNLLLYCIFTILKKSIKKNCPENNNKKNKLCTKPLYISFKMTHTKNFLCLSPLTLHIIWVYIANVYSTCETCKVYLHRKYSKKGNYKMKKSPRDNLSRDIYLDCRFTILKSVMGEIHTPCHIFLMYGCSKPRTELSINILPVSLQNNM